MKIRNLRQLLFVTLTLTAGGVIEYYDTEIGICVLALTFMAEVFFTSIYGETFSIGMWFERKTSPYMYYFLQTLRVSVLVVAVTALSLGVV